MLRRSIAVAAAACGARPYKGHSSDPAHAQEFADRQANRSRRAPWPSSKLTGWCAAPLFSTWGCPSIALGVATRPIHTSATVWVSKRESASGSMSDLNDTPIPMHETWQPNSTPEPMTPARLLARTVWSAFQRPEKKRSGTVHCGSRRLGISGKRCKSKLLTSLCRDCSALPRLRLSDCIVEPEIQRSRCAALAEYSGYTQQNTVEQHRAQFWEGGSHR